MSNPPDHDRTPPNGANRHAGGIPIVRASIVIVAFVVATVLLLGVLHPPATTSASSSAPGTTTSTTQPAHPSTTTTTVALSRAPVLVANASAVSGAAAAVTSRLQVAGWNMLPPVNASTRVPTSHVYYLAGQQQVADAVATSLHLPTTVVVPYTTAAPITSIGTAEVVVVVGPDLATASTATTTTPTTAARSTTSSTVN